jgi:hypothetical protein
MTISEAEHRLRATLPIHSVAELEGFPCANYADFLEANRTGRVDVLTRYDPETVDAFGSRGEKFMHYALAWTPALFAVALLVLSFLFWNFWLLLGIPLALFGFLLSSPAFMKGLGSPLLLIVFAYFVYSWIKGQQTATFLSGAYALSNFLTGVSREYCNSIARRVIEQSELLLVWLALRKVIIVRPRN